MNNNINEEKLNGYLIFLNIEKNLSFNTIDSYKCDLRSFFEFVDKDYNKVEENEVEDYIRFLNELGLSDRSINHKITSIKMFYKYLVKENLIEANIIDNISRPKKSIKLPDYLTIEEMECLLNFELTTSYDYRNKAMLELMYATGVRVSELINVRVRDIDFYEDYIRVIGKGNKERLIPLGDICLKYLRIYLDSHYRILLKDKECEYLFLSSRSSKMTRQAFFKILNQIALKQGISKNIYPHIIRHSFATHLLNNGASLIVIKELLGHENIATTGMYTHLSIVELKENYNLYHPHK